MEPTQNKTNDIELTNASNDIFVENNKNQFNNDKHLAKPKNSILKRIFILLVFFVALLIVIKFVFLRPTGQNNSDNISSDFVNLKISKNYSKGKNIEGYSEIKECGSFYYSLSKTNKTIVVDSYGNEVATSDNVGIPYCFNDGTIFMNDNTVWRNNEKIYSYDPELCGAASKCNQSNFYKDNIFYYSYPNNMTIAYDLKNKTKLWSADGWRPIVVNDVAILDDGDTDRNNIVNSKTGEVIAQTTDDVSIYAGYEYYAKVKHIVPKERRSANPYIATLEVYNYKNELISKNKRTNEDKCNFETMLTNGSYLITCNSDSYLYNPKSEEIYHGSLFEFDTHNQIEVWTSRFRQVNEIDNKDFSIIPKNGDSRLFVYSDGRQINYTVNNFDPTDTRSRDKYQDERIFLDGRSDDRTTNLLYNYKTGNNIQIPATTNIRTLYGGNYVMVELLDDKYNFYDKNLKKLPYEVESVSIDRETKKYSSAPLFPLNNEWIIRNDKETKKIYLVDILNNKEEELDININEDEKILISNANSIVIGKNNNYTFYYFK